MEHQTNRRCRRYIRIEKQSQWEMIDRLMELPMYKKSFNKVIADALDYGLPRLLNNDMQEESGEKEGKQDNQDIVLELYLSKTVQLLKEIIINATINKSLLCSLFEARSLELNGERVSGKNFKEGKFRDTPQYLAAYEMRALQKLRE